MKCIRMLDDRIMNVVLNGKLLEEVKLFKYLGPYIEIDGEINDESEVHNE